MGGNNTTDSTDIKKIIRGAWMAQLVEHPTSAQAMILQFMRSSPKSGSVLTAQSLEPASDSVYVSLSVLPQLALSLSKNKHFFKFNEKCCLVNILT